MATAAKSGVVCVWESVSTCASGCGHENGEFCLAHMCLPRSTASFGARAVELGRDRVVTGGNDGRVLVWPLAPYHARTCIPRPSRIVNDYSKGAQVFDLCSCDDAFLVSASADHRARIVDFRHRE